jgi:Holliday junction resolvase RusA-like endonuclease
VSPHGFTIHIAGAPAGKGRARFGHGRTFTPKDTVMAENDIRAAWKQAGAPRLEGPIALDVELHVTRPRAHFTTTGALSSVGRRMPRPSNRKPDVDNACKLVMDSLNTRAWADDVQVVELSVLREWADVPCTTINARELS